MLEMATPHAATLWGGAGPALQSFSASMKEGRGAPGSPEGAASALPHQRSTAEPATGTEAARASTPLPSVAASTPAEPSTASTETETATATAPAPAPAPAPATASASKPSTKETAKPLPKRPASFTPKELRGSLHFIRHATRLQANCLFAAMRNEALPRLSLNLAGTHEAWSRVCRGSAWTADMTLHANLRRLVTNLNTYDSQREGRSGVLYGEMIVPLYDPLASSPYVATEQSPEVGTKGWDVDVVFVHGLQGCAINTWRFEPGGTKGKGGLIDVNCHEMSSFLGGAAGQRAWQEGLRKAPPQVEEVAPLMYSPKEAAHLEDADTQAYTPHTAGLCSMEDLYYHQCLGKPPILPALASTRRDPLEFMRSQHPERGFLRLWPIVWLVPDLRQTTTAQGHRLRPRVLSVSYDGSIVAGEVVIGCQEELKNAAERARLQLVEAGECFSCRCRSLCNPCYAMLCYAMLCYAMLCYAMLCYAMLCYCSCVWCRCWEKTCSMGLSFPWRVDGEAGKVPGLLLPSPLSNRPWIPLELFV